MFTDFGIFPSETSSCGSLTSKSCISPSITISFRHSRPIWLWSASLLQDQIRSLGPALAESALAITTRGKTLCESTVLVNLATAREAIMKWFDALLLRVTANFYAARTVLTSFISIQWHFREIYIIKWRHRSVLPKVSPRSEVVEKINDFKFLFCRENFFFFVYVESGTKSV